MTVRRQSGKYRFFEKSPGLEQIISLKLIWMSYKSLDKHLPAIAGLPEHDKITAKPKRDLKQF